MKKLLMAMAFTTLTIGSARADYQCVGENNSTLTIHQFFTRNIEVSQVEAILTSEGQEKIFAGHYFNSTKEYKLYDSNQNPVELKVASPIFHGGRCGRCSPESDFPKKYYAKLTINQQQHNFTCTNTL